MVPLTSDKRRLRDEVARYGTYSATAGHLGTGWAWYMLSPKWASVVPAASRPAAYDDKNTIKTVILMTDGIYNTFGGLANAAASQKRSKELCANMKSEGVVVYTIGFDLEHAGPAKADAISVLSECASASSKFFRAEKPEELRAAFRAIALDISNLRLAR